MENNRKPQIGDKVHVYANGRIVDKGQIVDLCPNINKAVIQRRNGIPELVDIDRLRPIQHRSPDDTITMRELNRALKKIQDAVFLDKWFTEHGCSKLSMKDLIDFSLDASIMTEILKNILDQPDQGQ